MRLIGVGHADLGVGHRQCIECRRIVRVGQRVNAVAQIGALVAWRGDGDGLGCNRLASL